MARPTIVIPTTPNSTNSDMCDAPPNSERLINRINRDTQIYIKNKILYKFVKNTHLPHLEAYEAFYTNNPRLHDHLLPITSPTGCSETHIAYTMPYISAPYITYPDLPHPPTSLDNLEILAFLLEMNFRGGLNTDLRNRNNILTNEDDPSDFFIIDYDYFQYSSSHHPLFPYDAIVFWETITNPDDKLFEGQNFAIAHANINNKPNKVRESYTNVMHSMKPMLNATITNCNKVPNKVPNKRNASLPIVFFGKGLCYLEKHLSTKDFSSLIGIAYHNGYTFWSETQKHIIKMLSPQTAP